MLENPRDPWGLILLSIGLAQLIIQTSVAVRCEDKASTIRMIGFSIRGHINVRLHWILLCLTEI
jgi:hypothetical protein